MRQRKELFQQARTKLDQLNLWPIEYEFYHKIVYWMKPIVYEY